MVGGGQRLGWGHIWRHPHYHYLCGRGVGRAPVNLFFSAHTGIAAQRGEGHAHRACAPRPPPLHTRPGRLLPKGGLPILFPSGQPERSFTDQPATTLKVPSRSGRPSQAVNALKQREILTCSSLLLRRAFKMTPGVLQLCAFRYMTETACFLRWSRIPDSEILQVSNPPK